MPVAGSVTEAVGWMSSRGNLLIPLALTVWIAWGDVKTRRIPNYLTLGTAVAGLAYNFMSHGLNGLADGFLGMLLGFACLILPYLWGGMGAGDVKALAALGAWLGPKLTVFLFCYMGIAGGSHSPGVPGVARYPVAENQGGLGLPAQPGSVPAGRPPPPSVSCPINRRDTLWGRHCRGHAGPGGGRRWL